MIREGVKEEGKVSGLKGEKGRKVKIKKNIGLHVKMGGMQITGGGDEVWGRGLRGKGGDKGGEVRDHSGQLVLELELRRLGAAPGVSLWLAVAHR